MNGKDRQTLVDLSRGKKVSVRLAERASIVLFAAEGKENISIAALLTRISHTLET